MRANWLAAVALVALVSACGGSSDPPASSGHAAPASTPATLATPAPVATTSPAASPAATAATAAKGLVVKTGGSDYGTILYDDTGQAIYLFDKEQSTTPDCYDDCAAAWPPVLTKGTPQAAGEAQAALLGSTRRGDGSTQVTYAGHPLYYYVHDGKNQVRCHNVREFGGLWLVVTPTGEAAPA